MQKFADDGWAFSGSVVFVNSFGTKVYVQVMTRQ